MICFAEHAHDRFFSVRIAAVTAFGHGRAFAVALAGAMLALGAVRPAFADESRVPFLVEKLRAPDFRLRTNAALSLGASGEDAAISPLCGALSDESDVVRQAATAGLKRLGKPAGVGCLKSRLASEPSDAVKLQLTRAIEALLAKGAGGGSEGLEPASNPNAKYYVALSSIQNRSGKTQGEVDSAVLGAVRKKLESAGTFQIAPNKETPEAAKSALKKRKLRGFYLAISVDPFDYASGTKATVRVAIFSYPNKDLKGESPGRARSGASKGDKSAEDSLLTAAAETAVQAFVDGAGQF
jgi:HEAT repeats